MKTLLIPLIAIAALAPLAGCVSPYYGDRYGYYEGERYAPYGDGYNGYYNRGAYGGAYGYDEGGGYVSGGYNGRGGYVSGGNGYGSFGFDYNRGRASGYYNGYYR